MEEKTRRLRDIFMDLAEDATVTERQEPSRGSLAPGERIDEQIRSVVETMRTRFSFRTSLPTEALVAVVRGYFDGQSDAEIARGLDGGPSRDSVARARLDLHLVAERDLDAPFDFDVLRESLAEERPTSAVADDLGVSESTVRRYRRAVEVQRERRAVDDRYRDEFARILSDRDLESRLTEQAHQTGLKDATEGMETNVSF